MSKLDDLILEALSAQEQDILKDTEELGWFALGVNLFTGKLGWVSWVVIIAQTCLFIVGAYMAWRFFQTTEMLIALKYGISASVLLLVAAMLKMSLMPQIQANRVLREIKRVELLILQQGRD